MAEKTVEVNVVALQPVVDYKTGISYAAGDKWTIERTEAELTLAIGNGLLTVVDEDEA